MPGKATNVAFSPAARRADFMPAASSPSRGCRCSERLSSSSHCVKAADLAAASAATAVKTGFERWSSGWLASATWRTRSTRAISCSSSSAAAAAAAAFASTSAASALASSSSRSRCKRLFSISASSAAAAVPPQTVAAVRAFAVAGRLVAALPPLPPLRPASLALSHAASSSWPCARATCNAVRLEEDLRRASAPRKTRAEAHSKWPLLAAKCNAVSPKRVAVTSSLAPCAARSCTISGESLITARCRGGTHALKFGSAPAERRSRTAPVCPAIAAMPSAEKGCVPPPSDPSRGRAMSSDALASRSSRTINSLPWRAAMWRGVGYSVTSGLPSGFAPTLMRALAASNATVSSSEPVAVR
mmetsp:Transcript_27582/g.88519  ORF Transcript_27582/g.88519 Transcript_27582/m.88519 type:complete len:359 (+) Transcript_27582:700-1776(+)